MRVDDRMRKCVVFVGIETHQRFTPLGTGFLGGIASEGLTFKFIVTADHVINQVRGPDVWVRVNRRDGQAATVRMPKAGILRHTNSNNDVALIPTALDPSVYDYMIQPLDRAEVEKFRKDTWEIGLGDEVCAIGLYTSHHGLTKNIPVVRIGNLAMLCEEPVRVQNSGYVDAYLIELRTIAGLSGSPVFVNVPLVRVHGEEIQYRKGKDLWPLPLGVLVGYHVVETKEDQIQVPQFSGSKEAASDEGKAPSIDERNTGFGVVIPLERAFEILERDDVKKKIAEAVEVNKKKGGYKPASAVSSSIPEADVSDAKDGPGHQERFNRLLGAAVKRPKSSG